MASLAPGCNAGGAVGEACDTLSDCRTDLQCFAGVCTLQCDVNAACGDGYRCASGVCEEVLADVGQACSHELDCGVAQSCRLAGTDDDEDGQMEATCQPDFPGGDMGSPCRDHEDCRSAYCVPSMNICSALCETDDDCPGGICTEIEMDLDDTSSVFFHGCVFPSPAAGSSGSRHGHEAHSVENPVGIDPDIGLQIE